MKKIIIIFVLISFSFQAFSQDSPLTYTALLNAVLEPDDLEFQGFLMGNDWKYIDNFRREYVMHSFETWGYGYNYNTKKAQMWIYIRRSDPINSWESQENESSETSQFSLRDESYIRFFTEKHYTYKYLCNKIEQYCVYEGTKNFGNRFMQQELNKPLYKKVYTHKSGVTFHIWNNSEGSNIEVTYYPKKPN